MGSLGIFNNLFSQTLNGECTVLYSMGFNLFGATRPTCLFFNIAWPRKSGPWKITANFALCNLALKTKFPHLHMLLPHCWPSIIRKKGKKRVHDFALISFQDMVSNVNETQDHLHVLYGSFSVKGALDNFSPFFFSKKLRFLLEGNVYVVTVC